MDEDREASSQDEISEKLRLIEKELESLTSSVSKDFRGHLRGISVSIHETLTCDQSRLDAHCREELVKIGETVKRMGLMIDGLLKVSALTRMPVQLEELDLSYLAAKAGVDVRRRHIGEVKLKVEEGLVGYGDVRLVASALDQLLDNAFRFALTSPSPLVEVGATEVNERTAFWIKDNGPGFAPSQARRIFEPVEKLSGSGAGIGLSSVKRIIERMGGRVWAQSTPGSGATFFFTLPEAP